MDELFLTHADIEFSEVVVDYVGSTDFLYDGLASGPHPSLEDQQTKTDCLFALEEKHTEDATIKQAVKGVDGLVALLQERLAAPVKYLSYGPATADKEKRS